MANPYTCANINKAGEPIYQMHIIHGIPDFFGYTGTLVTQIDYMRYRP